MHISYKPLWHMLIERNMKKEDLGLAAGLTTNMIASMGKRGKTHQHGHTSTVPVYQENRNQEVYNEITYKTRDYCSNRRNNGLQ